VSPEYTTRRARSRKELPEEQPKAYKDVDAVVDVVHNAGLSKKGRAVPADRGDQERGRNNFPIHVATGMAR
jgi:hypothetical protein